MPIITVRVFDSEGNPAAGHRVVLSHGPLGYGGMSKPEYTDEDGVVTFEVDHGATGQVYVDGKEYDQWGATTNPDVEVGL